MSGLHKLVIDTNTIFMSWYNPFGKCAEILRYAREGKIELFSTDSVREEIVRVFRRNGLKEREIQDFLVDLPISWVDKQIYVRFIEKTKVKHKADKPLEALSLVLNCEILSADNDFKNRLDLNKFLKRLESEEAK